MTTEEIQRTKCEVYSRVCGYIRPITQWNEGKQCEWEDRQMFKINKEEENEKKNYNSKIS